MANLRALNKKGFEYVCGVDEAGRGPLAGPLSLSFFVISLKDHEKVLKPLLKEGLNDSKQIKEKRREFIYEILRSNLGSVNNKPKNIKMTDSKVGPCFFNSMISAEQIDRYGISKCYKILIQRLLKKVSNTKNTYFLLDGSIKFPEKINHEVIIKGDSIEPTIMAASIVSKVMRDRKMKVLAKKYPKYNLEIHKGYGTKKHREAIKKFGTSKIHRKSFCRNI